MRQTPRHRTLGHASCVRALHLRPFFFAARLALGGSAMSSGRKPGQTYSRESLLTLCCNARAVFCGRLPAVVAVRRHFPGCAARKCPSESSGSSKSPSRTTHLPEGRPESSTCKCAPSVPHSLILRPKHKLAWYWQRNGLLSILQVALCNMTYPAL